MGSNVQEGINALRDSGALPRRGLVEVTIAVPLSDIDFTDCTVAKTTEPTEFWGANEYTDSFDVDLTGALWMGYPVTFSDRDADIADQYLIAEKF